MRTERGLSRLVGFSDGVVAIAITLLVLPLVTAATEVDVDAGTFLVDNAYQLLVLVLSFAVIGRFWIAHHQMYENVIAYKPSMLWATLLWLLTIVFLPFPTQLLATADRDSRITYGLYIGTMVLTALAALLQQWIIVRNPELHNPEVRGTLDVGSYATIAGALIVCLLLAVLVPGVGLLSLLLLFVSGPIESLIRRKQRKKS